MKGRTLTRADLAEAVYQEVGLSRSESAELVDSILTEIGDSLVADGVVKISSFHWIDPPVFGQTSPRTVYFMATVEAHRIPGLGQLMRSFGTFSVRRKGRRIGRNPKTGEEVPIMPRRVLVFRPSQLLKDRINGQGETTRNAEDD